MIDMSSQFTNRNPDADWALANRVRRAVQWAIAATEPASSVEASNHALLEYNRTHDPDAEVLTSELNEERLQRNLPQLHDGNVAATYNGNFPSASLRYVPCRMALIEIERIHNKQADLLFNGNTAYSSQNGSITLTPLAENMRSEVALRIAIACINDALSQDTLRFPYNAPKGALIDYEDEP